MRVDLWIAIDEGGRGAIALTKQDALDAIGSTPRVALANFACWDLSAAMIRGGTLPLQFALEQHGTRSTALREARRW